MKAPALREPDGFSFPELMVVVVLAAVIVVALHQLLIGQIHFHEMQRGVSQRNESIRHAMAVLGTTLREASFLGGDLEVLAADRLRARVPHGTGIACGVDDDGSHVGIVDPRGQWAVGDSILVERASARFAHRIEGLQPAGEDVPCTVPAAGTIVLLDQAVPDLDAGSAARPFRSHVFESSTADGAEWLYRVDGLVSEVLVGPLDSVSGFAVWYEDLAGLPVTAADAERVVVRVVARAPATRAGGSPLRDTLLLRFGGRN